MLLTSSNLENCNYDQQWNSMGPEELIPILLDSYCPIGSKGQTICFYWWNIVNLPFYTNSNWIFIIDWITFDFVLKIHENVCFCQVQSTWYDVMSYYANLRLHVLIWNPDVRRIMYAWLSNKVNKTKVTPICFIVYK